MALEAARSFFGGKGNGKETSAPSNGSQQSKHDLEDRQRSPRGANLGKAEPGAALALLNDISSSHGEDITSSLVAADAEGGHLTDEQLGVGDVSTPAKKDRNSQHPVDTPPKVEAVKLSLEDRMSLVLDKRDEDLAKVAKLAAAEVVSETKAYTDAEIRKCDSRTDEKVQGLKAEMDSKLQPMNEKIEKLIEQTQELKASAARSAGVQGHAVGQANEELKASVTVLGPDEKFCPSMWVDLLAAMWVEVRRTQSAIADKLPVVDQAALKFAKKQTLLCESVEAAKAILTATKNKKFKVLKAGDESIMMSFAPARSQQEQLMGLAMAHYNDAFRAFCEAKGGNVWTSPTTGKLSLSLQAGQVAIELVKVTLVDFDAGETSFRLMKLPPKYASWAEELRTLAEKGKQAFRQSRQ